MADTKISALPSGAPAQAADEYIVARSGANYKLTLTNIAASMPPIGATTPNTGVFTTVTATTANATTVDATNVEVTNIKAKDGTAAISIADSTGAVTVSTKAEFADGSASAPAITNTGDTNTGVYFPAADEVAVAVGGSVAAAFNSNGLFFRNRIINGDMRIDQRNAGAAVTINGTANTYTVDRWVASGQATDGVYTVDQVTDAPTGGGFTNSLKITVTTADASIGASQIYTFGQFIEGLNTADLMWGSASARAVTLSFWVQASVTGTYSVALKNSDANRAYVATYAINSANTWEYKTITVPGDTTGTWLTDTGRGIGVRFNLGAGTDYNATANSWTATNGFSVSGQVQLISTLNATFFITGVQLESGSVATPFERRPYGTELNLCYRYYYRLTPGVVNGLFATAYVVLTNFALGQTQFPVPMRVRPTALEQSGTANQYEVAHANTTTTCSAVPTYQAATTASSASTFFQVSSGLTIGQGCAFRADTTNGATAYLGWSAEL